MGQAPTEQLEALSWTTEPLGFDTEDLPGGPEVVDPSLPFTLKTINIHIDFSGLALLGEDQNS